MALFDTVWYANFGNGSTTGYYAVAAWQALHVYAAGAIVRQAATPAVGSERTFVCIIAGTSLGSEPTWTVTRGARTAEAAGPTWQECTGMPGTNGDTANAVTTATTRSQAITLGEMIYDTGTASLQICSVAGTCGSGTPSFSTTAGTTTADNTTTWTSLGLASGYGRWASPHARLQAVCAATWGAAGNTIFLGGNHAETQAALMAIPVGGSTTANPYKIYCVDQTASFPLTNANLATTATVTTTGTNNIQINCNVYFYGVQFFVGSGAVNVTIFWGTGNTYQAYSSCVFKIVASGTASTLSMNSGNSVYSSVTFDGCQFQFSNASQTISLAWTCAFKGNCLFANAGTVPTSLFTTSGSASRGGRVVVRDSDLSNITGTLFSVSGGNALYIYVENSKLANGVTVTTGTQLGPNACNLSMVNCDSTSTNYRYFYSNMGGTVQQETTIVRTGGATDGTTPISWNMTSNTNPKWQSPFASEQIAQWQDTTGSVKTATVYLTTNTTLNNDDFWIDVEYPSSSSFPVGASISSGIAPLQSNSVLTTDTSTWGGSITNKYKIVVSFTPQMKGPVKLRLSLAKQSVTVYVDPYIYIQ